jgi:hypothetical protein
MDLISDEKDCAADSNEGMSSRRVSRVSEKEVRVDVRPVVVRWSDRKVG